jgi:hypothetical protein
MLHWRWFKRWSLRTHHLCLIKTGASTDSAVSSELIVSVMRRSESQSDRTNIGLLIQTRFGNTALHFAVWKNRGEESLRIVQFLLDYYPQSAKMENNSDNLPLHWAANFKAPMPIVQLIYRSYPQAIEKLNNKSQTPLQQAIKRLGENHPVVVMLQGDSSRNYAYDQHVHTAEATLKEAEIWDSVNLHGG